MSVQSTILKNVSCVRLDPAIGGGRRGTAIAEESTIVSLFGKAQRVNSADAKITKSWIFKTPRGFACLRDYWWNAKAEWSLTAQNPKSFRWMVRYLRLKGIIAGEQIRMQVD